MLILAVVVVVVDVNYRLDAVVVPVVAEII